MDFRKNILNKINAPGNPYEMAKKFLWHPWADAESEEEIVNEIKSIIDLNPRSILRGVQAIEMLLTKPEEHDLVHLVALEANQVLDDPSQKGSIIWLEDTVKLVKGILKEKGHDTGSSIVLGKKVALKKFDLNHGILYSDRENEDAEITLEMSKHNKQFSDVTFKIKDFVQKKFRLLPAQISKEDLATLMKNTKLTSKLVGNMTFYKTKDKISAFYHIVQPKGASNQFLVCVGYGEYQPMRYVVSLASIHELK